jgi:NAD/NADP transhydrogenase alpha subunit
VLLAERVGGRLAAYDDADFEQAGTGVVSIAKVLAEAGLVIKVRAPEGGRGFADVDNLVVDSKTSICSVIYVSR